jgi:hypothetical protein
LDKKRGVMDIYQISLKETKDSEKINRDSIGGYPVLTENQELPECAICNKKMVMFLQLDIKAEYNLPFKEGSHLSFFMCIDHDEPVWWDGTEELPASYMEREHYQVFFNPPGVNEKTYELEPGLVHSALQFTKLEEEVETVGPDNKEYEIGRQLFKIGGVPSWAQDPEIHTCSCGAKMSFICQVPQDFQFTKAEGAESQKSTYSDTHYSLFLGNEVYIFACENQCSPLAVAPICQCD